MKWEVKVTNVVTRLRRRTGPSTSYRIVNWIYPGKTGIVVDIKNVGKAVWYKWEDGKWSCAKTAGGTVYLTKVKDLEEKVDPPKPEPKPEPAPKPEEPPYVAKEIDETAISNDLGKKFGSYDWYAKSSYSYGTYDVVTDEVINKELDRIRYNMDIAYVDKNDIYGQSTNGYLSDIQKKLHHSFNRYKTPFVDKELSKTFAYVFFTRPDLNILEYADNTFTLKSQCFQDPKYNYCFRSNSNTLRSLVGIGNPNHKFLVLLSNEALSFEVSDMTLKTLEHGETYNGNKIIYGSTDHESVGSGEMNISYRDTPALDIFKMHLIWTDYINKVSRGLMDPKEEYIKQKILDYAVSCYYFLCGPDGSSILYWQKLTGVFPINTGENAFSWDDGTLLAKPEINIKYMYSMRTSMDIVHLQEFNDLVLNVSDYKDTYSPDNCQTGSTLTHCPYIMEAEASNGSKLYRLMWLES